MTHLMTMYNVARSSGDSHTEAIRTLAMITRLDEETIIRVLLIARRDDTRGPWSEEVEVDNA